MSLQQYSSDHGRSLTGHVPARVFENVAPTPWLPGLRWWNNPVVVLFASLAAALALAFVPGAPPLTGLLTAVSGVAMVLCMSAHLWWPLSREKAVAEATWVAAQSGYRISAHGDLLRWSDEDGTARQALVVRGGDGWDLVLSASAEDDGRTA